MEENNSAENTVGKIDHPKHYCQGKIECIDVIEDWQLNFNLGSVLKYICRADHKGSTEEDCRKALWYMQREVIRRYGQGGPVELGRGL